MAGDIQRIADLESAPVAEAVAQHSEVVESLYVAGSVGARPLVVVRPMGFLTAAELRRHCRELGVAAEFDVLFIDETQAVDTAAPDAAWLTANAAPDALSLFEAPDGEIETQLVAVWERILDFTPISVHDDFVDVGGDSLSAMEIAVAIAQRWDVNLSLVDLVDASSVRNLSELVRAAQASR